jgi:carboxyl-terminal processing protease
MNDFISFGKSKGVTFDQAQYDADKLWLQTYIKATIARNLFGNEGHFRAVLDADPQYQKALTLFPEAARIAGLAVQGGASAPQKH